ncbi:type II secretion system protein [Patescibacteria group bacterium]|nr:type II secretion system protein [Patescibacteria group bacterium]
MKTHSNTSQNGFTLIELLVVVAIIGLLSSVTLASVQTGRTKGENSAKIQLVKQYVNALALYRTSNINSTYPVVTSGTYFCLGTDNPSDTCYGNVSSENTTLNTALAPYISGPPASRSTIQAGAADMRGITYTCLNSACTEYSMRWVISGGNSICTIGTYDGLISSNTVCKYDSNVNAS